jgi:hypothetical protein
MSRRYERGSVLITSNRSVGEWGTVFGDPVVVTAILGFARTQIGKPYDWTAILALLMDRDWRDSGAWFCSELVVAALEAVGFWPRPWAFPYRPNEIDPMIRC